MLWEWLWRGVDDHGEGYDAVDNMWTTKKEDMDDDGNCRDG